MPSWPWLGGRGFPGGEAMNGRKMKKAFKKREAGRPLTPGDRRRIADWNHRFVLRAFPREAVMAFLDQVNRVAEVLMSGRFPALSDLVDEPARLFAGSPDAHIIGRATPWPL